jgi:hypothetical protein
VSLVWLDRDGAPFPAFTPDPSNREADVRRARSASELDEAVSSRDMG